jgi:hypothetical protein
MAFFPQLFRLTARSKRAFLFYVDQLSEGALASASFIAGVVNSIASNSSRLMFEDFLSGSAGSFGPFIGTQTNNGTLSSTNAFVDDTSKSVGVVAIGTGTASASGMSSLTTSTSASSLVLGSKNFSFEARLSGSTSTAAQEYSLSVGFAGGNLSTTTLNAVNCAYFRYRRVVDGVFWTCITAKDSDADPTNPTNTTKVVTTVAFDANDMHIFRIDVSTAGVATFYIDNVLVATISTNVPTDPGAFAHQVGIGARVLKSNGTGTARSAFIDYMKLVA